MTRSSRARCGLACLVIVALAWTMVGVTAARAATRVATAAHAATTAATAAHAATTAATAAHAAIRASADASAQPSSAAIAGWNLVDTDQFTGTSLGADWKEYLGQPGGDPGGWWNTNHVVVSNGLLDLRGYRDTSQGAPAGTWATGGVMQTGLTQTYGKYLVRARMQKGAGVAPVLLLWPASTAWTPEIDFAEDGGARPREVSQMTFHPGPDISYVSSTVNVNWARWHTYGVEWTPGRLVWTLDGRDVGTTIVSGRVPDVPMRLAIQDQMEGPNCGTGFKVCPNSATPAEVDFKVDWIQEYAG